VRFFVAYWGWLMEEGSCRWPAPPLIQDGCHLGFGFCQLSNKHLSWLVIYVS
jgi:hypothetical protein